MFRLLKADEIEVKVKQIKQNGSVFLLYKTARTDMALLDETVGPMSWQSDYRVINDNLYAGIGIHSAEIGWIWKWDCGVESREDGDGNEKKGEASDAFKRAGFKWGIGRELYTAPFIWISSDVVPTVQMGNNWKLKNAFAKYSVSKIGYNEKREITMLEIVDDKGRTVYAHGSKTPIKVAPMAEQTNADVLNNQLKPLSEQAKRDIAGATTLADLTSVYNAYATTEPIIELKEACGKRKAELSGGVVA